jgi:hypothetical protein
LSTHSGSCQNSPRLRLGKSCENPKFSRCVPPLSVGPKWSSACFVIVLLSSATFVYNASATSWFAAWSGSTQKYTTAVNMLTESTGLNTCAKATAVSASPPLRGYLGADAALAQDDVWAVGSFIPPVGGYTSLS